MNISFQIVVNFFKFFKHSNFELLLETDISRIIKTNCLLNTKMFEI